MKLAPNIKGRGHPGVGFTLVEVLMSMGLLGVIAVAFYSSLSQTVNMLAFEREDLRATQILLQKTETIRLYSWDQVNSNGFIPVSFTVPYDPQSTNPGVTYTGTVTIASTPLSTPYSSDLKMVTLRLNWTTGRVPRQRELKTFVARYGLQTYVD